MQRSKDSEHWEKMLRDDNLGMDRGLDSNHLSYVGTSINLLNIEEETAGIQIPYKTNVSTKEGIRFYNSGCRVSPKGHGPAADE